MIVVAINQLHETAPNPHRSNFEPIPGVGIEMRLIHPHLRSPRQATHLTNDDPIHIRSIPFYSPNHRQTPFFEISGSQIGAANPF